MLLAFSFSCPESHMKRVIYLHRLIILDSVRANRVHRPCFIFISHEPPIILHDHFQWKEQSWLNCIRLVNKTLILKRVCIPNMRDSDCRHLFTPAVL